MTVTWKKLAYSDHDHVSIAGKSPYHGVQAIGTIAFDASGHSLSVASITYWHQGVVYTTASPITCDLDLTADRDHASASLTTGTLYYFYFKDATGKLYWSPVFWNLNTMVPVATVFWNGSAGAVSKESHNYTRNIDWHIWSHLTVGARYGSGLDKIYPTTSVDGSLQIETGTIYDEDLSVSTGQQTTMRGYYKTNSTTWTFADFSLPYTGALGAPTYLDTDTYALTTYASNRYACYWVFATTDIDKPIAVLPTHATDPYSQITAARAELQPSVSGINPEWKLIYRFIFAGDGQFQESADYRLQSSLAGAVSTATTAGAVSFTPSGSVAATTVQAAIEEVDVEKVSHSLAIAENDFLVGAPTPFGSWVKKTLVETRTILGTGIIWNLVSADANAIDKNGYMVNASSGNVTITLPATPATGATVAILDAYHKASTNVITVGRNSSKIEALAEDLIININGAGFILVYVDATRGWEIASEVGSGAASSSAVEIDAHTAQSPTAAQLATLNMATIHNYDQAAADINNSLPATAVNLGFMANVATAQAGNYWRFTAASAGTIYLNGSATGKDYVQYTAPEVGNYFSAMTQKRGAEYVWVITDGIGSLTTN